MFVRYIAIFTVKNWLNICSAIAAALLLAASFLLLPGPSPADAHNSTPPEMVVLPPEYPQNDDAAPEQNQMPADEAELGEYGEMLPDERTSRPENMAPPEWNLTMENAAADKSAATIPVFATKPYITDMEMPAFPVTEQAEGTSAPPGAGKLKEPPRLLSSIRPEYPAKALRNGIQGRVTVQFTVNVHGRAENVEIIAAEPPHIFDGAATDAVTQARFQPAVGADGRAVPAKMQLPIAFRLFQ